MVNITRKGGRLLSQRVRRSREAATTMRPRKTPRPPKHCLNPQASIAGFIVAFCDCMICNHRRGTKP
jgi:hypothetical protein